MSEELVRDALTIRPARESDADAIDALAAEFVDYLRALGAHDAIGITGEQYRRDGFGERPAFAGLVVERNGAVVGYLIYHEGYDIDRGGRVLHIIDLFVTARARGGGAGRMLMETTRDICRGIGGVGLMWSVYPPNAVARAFYERLGATYADDMLMSWQI